MAATYRLKAQNVVFGTNKSMVSLWNGSGSTDILKVNRIYLLNNQVGVAAGTGVLVQLELRLITAHTSVQRLFPFKLKQSSPDLHANVIGNTGATVTDSSLFRRIIWSGDEPSQNELNTDTFQLIPSLNLIWDSGYVGSGIEPITLNANQGIHLKCITATTATFLGNCIIEFTK